MESKKRPNKCGIGLRRCSLELIMCCALGIFINLSSHHMSLGDYYGRLQGICEEIDLSEPIWSDIAIMK